MLAATRRGRRRRLGLTLLAFAVCETSAGADQARLIIDFLSPRNPAPFVPIFTLEMGATSPGGLRLPRFTLVNADGGPRIAQYGSELPSVTLGGFTLAARYGDQRLAVAPPTASLTGLGIDARPLRGLSLTARAKASSFSLALGQVGARETGMLQSTIPRVVSFAGTIGAHPRLSLAPRLVLPIGRASAPGAAAAGLGTGGRWEVAGHLAVVGDVGATRLSPGTWAHSAAGGVTGDWLRASFELSLARADRGYGLLGPVAFAGVDRETLTTRIALRPGQTLSGLVGMARPHGRGQAEAGSVTSSLVWRAERVSGGTLTAAFDGNADRLRRLSSFRVEWQGAPAGWASTVRLFVRRHTDIGAGLATSAYPELFVQIRPPAGLVKWLSLDGRATVALSEPPAGTPRARWFVASAVAIAKRLSVGTETDVALGGLAGAPWLSKLRVTAEVGVTKTTSVRVAYGHGVGAPAKLIQRLEARIVRTLGS